MKNVSYLANKVICGRLRFKTKVCPILDGDDIYEAVVIVLANETTGQLIDATRYSDILLSNKILNLERNTRLGYAKFITMFLNFVFFDRESISDKYTSSTVKQKNLDRIENLTMEDGNYFLNAYKVGNVGHNGVKTKNSILIAEAKLTNFYYHLYKNYKMINLKGNNFIFTKYKIRNNDRVTELTKLKSLFLVRYPTKQSGRTRLEYITFYSLSEFIMLALEHYPMIALGIALQAFAGLRKGEVCNTTRFNTAYSYMGKELKDWNVNLKAKPILRSDGINVGEIKSHAIAHVHPIFLPFFEMILREHDKYVNEVFKKKNRYGAMFMNRFGEALTEDSYERYFNLLVEMLTKKLFESGNPTAISEANRIFQFGFTTHTLRYFFSNYIAMLPDTNILDLAMYRRDKNLESVMIYIRNNPYLIDNRIKAIQDEAMRKSGLYNGE